LKIEGLNVADLRSYCISLGLNTKKIGKKDLILSVKEFELREIETSISQGDDSSLLKKKIKALADNYALNLNSKIANRKEEMKSDDNSHYLIYRVLGISNDEGSQIDIYQNAGRFLYKYAGSFLEDAATICLLFSNRSGGKTLIPNNQSARPNTFEIDFLCGNDAIEIKWRDATTDGDHITKEHTRVKAITEHGHNPIRVMFYYPQREQAIKIQGTLKTLYAGVSGEYYAGDEAWEFLLGRTGYDLKAILTEIADERENVE
jgi:hypothetical protein